jgi:Ca-activated chloride channel homolog
MVMENLHLLRPLWLLAYIPWLYLLWLYLFSKQATSHSSWHDLCDPHLLPHITAKSQNHRQSWPLWCMFIAVAFMILSLVGLSWSRLTVPTYQRVQPRVILLDLSTNMLQTDLRPSRLDRAKFKLHDLFSQHDLGQTGLIAYSGEPFVVSPLTDDGKTMDDLVTVLHPNILPIAGNNLSLALREAQALLERSGSNSGQVLVLTGDKPDKQAILSARQLAKQKIYVSILPLIEEQGLLNKFTLFARAGHGKNLRLSDQNNDLAQWLALSTKTITKKSQNNAISVWQDQGRWFIIPALLLLLPTFRRNWLQGLNA